MTKGEREFSSCSRWDDKSGDLARWLLSASGIRLPSSIEHESFKYAVKSSLIFSFDGLAGGNLRTGEIERGRAGGGGEFFFAMVLSGTGEVACADCRSRILDFSRFVAVYLDVPFEAEVAFGTVAFAFGSGTFELALFVVLFVVCIRNL